MIPIQLIDDAARSLLRLQQPRVRPDDAVSRVFVLAEIDFENEAVNAGDFDVDLYGLGVAEGIEVCVEYLFVTEDAHDGLAELSLGLLEADLGFEIFELRGDVIREDTARVDGDAVGVIAIGELDGAAGKGFVDAKAEEPIEIRDLLDGDRLHVREVNEAAIGGADARDAGKGNAEGSAPRGLEPKRVGDGVVLIPLARERVAGSEHDGLAQHRVAFRFGAAEDHPDKLSEIDLSFFIAELEAE